MGIAHVGYDSLGKPLQRYVSSKKRTEVVKKLKDLRRKIDDRLLLKDEDVKVTELFERWFNDIIRHQIASPSTFSNYQTVVRTLLAISNDVDSQSAAESFLPCKSDALAVDFTSPKNLKVQSESLCSDFKCPLAEHNQREVDPLATNSRHLRWEWISPYRPLVANGYRKIPLKSLSGKTVDKLTHDKSILLNIKHTEIGVHTINRRLGRKRERATMAQF
jgi:hypothetical protein